MPQVKSETFAMSSKFQSDSLDECLQYIRRNLTEKGYDAYYNVKYSEPCFCVVTGRNSDHTGYMMAVSCNKEEYPYVRRYFLGE